MSHNQTLFWYLRSPHTHSLTLHRAQGPTAAARPPQQQNIILKAAQTNFPIFTRRYSPDSMRCAWASRIDMDTRIYMPTSYSSHLNRNQAPIFTLYSIKCHRFQKSAVFQFLHNHVPLMCPPPISAPTPCCAWQSRICHQIYPNQSLNIPINQPTQPSLPLCLTTLSILIQSSPHSPYQQYMTVSSS